MSLRSFPIDQVQSSLRQRRDETGDFLRGMLKIRIHRNDDLMAALPDPEHRRPVLPCISWQPEKHNIPVRKQYPGAFHLIPYIRRRAVIHNDQLDPQVCPVHDQEKALHELGQCPGIIEDRSDN